MFISYKAFVFIVTCIGVLSLLEAITAKTPMKQDIYAFIFLLAVGSMIAVHWAIAMVPKVLEGINHLSS